MAISSSFNFAPILKAFDLPAGLTAVPLGRGHINDTFLLTAPAVSSSKYVLQRINHHVFKAPQQLMENVQLIKDHLEKKGYCSSREMKLLTWLKTRRDQLLHCDTDGNIWRANQYLEGTVTIEYIENINQAFCAAQTFARFVWNLRELSPNSLHYTIPEFHNMAKRMEQLEEAIVSDPLNRAGKAGEEIELIRNNSRIVAEFDKLQALEELPLRVTHNDTKISNMLFEEGTEEVIAVIDLDTVMPGYVIFDFGDMMRTFTPASGEDEPDLSKVYCRKDIVAALSRGYLDGCRDMLTETERKNLLFGGKLMTYMQGVRFLTDFLTGDRYYQKIFYKEQNLKRAQNQLKLLASFEENEEEIQALILNS